MSRLVAVVLQVAVVAVGLVAVGWVSPAGADWQPPVEAPIVDPFRPPTTKYGAGNRGIEYGLDSVQPISAVDSGRVVFAGAVGAGRHITIDHGDGLRSTYAFVETIAVVRGQHVARGAVIGTAGSGFHLTARLGEVYVDPQLLFAGFEVQVRLVSGELPTVPTPASRAAAADGVDRSFFDPALAFVDAGLDLQLASQLVALADAAAAWQHVSCTSDATAVAGPQGPRVLIQVGGLGSSDASASIGGLDARSLGYADTDVIGFSYGGGCTPLPFGLETSASISSELEADGRSPTPLSEQLASTTYGPQDTYQDIGISADRLADLIESAAAARPGQPIDVAAHSLGGVVTRLALDKLAARGVVLPAVVFTIGSPHGGADLATAAQTTIASPIGSAIDQAVGSDKRVADSVAQIAEAGVAHLAPPSEPPDGVRVVAVAGATDLVVPADHATWDGATNVIVPTSPLDAPSVHGDLPRMTEVHREFELALVGAAPRCVGLDDVLASVVQGRAISTVQDTASVVLGAGRWLF